MLLKIKEEVRKQFDAGFLEVAKYPEWVANIVLIPKKYGKVRMCVDYRDLNRASPKTTFFCHISTLWWTIWQRTPGFHSWMISLDIIRFEWLLKIGRKLLL